VVNIVYGGSFNPPTKAHYEIVLSLLEKYENAKIIIVPVGNTYIKKGLIDFKHRQKMLEIIFKDFPNVIISDIENCKQYDGTLKTLEDLEKNHTNLYFVMGSDNLVDFDKWHNYDKILAKYPIIIVKRNNQNIKKMLSNFSALSPKYEIVEFKHPANSTAIRKNLEKNKNWVHDEIYNYIKVNNLYRKW